RGRFDCGVPRARHRRGAVGRRLRGGTPARGVLVAQGYSQGTAPWLCSKTSDVWVVATAGFADRLSSTNWRTSFESRTATWIRKSSAPPRKNSCVTPGLARISSAKEDI